MPTLDNKGVNIYYETVGSPSNPAVIFNHGNGNSLQNWRDFDYLTPLKEHFYLVLVDARGFGHSDKPHDAEQYTAEKQTSDFIAVLDALQIKKAHYFGNSRGGRMAYTFQALHPDRFLSFTICGADPAGEQLSNKFITWLHQGMAVFVQNLETEIGIKLPPELRRTFLANDPLAMIAANASIITYPNAFEHSDTPCLVIVGDRDPICQAVIASMSKIKSGQLKILPGLNHADTYMHGSKIATLLREFITANLPSEKTSMSKIGQYVFDPVAAEAQRLTILNQEYNPHSQSLLTPFLKPGTRVLEVGPGVGIMAEWIADKIAPGEYVALDREQKQLDATTARLHKIGLKNFKVQQGLLENINKLNLGLFDVIYFRWVFAYLPHETREDILRNIYQNALNPEGVLILEECSINDVRCYKKQASDGSLIACQHEGFEGWEALSRAIEVKCGIDFQLENIATICNTAGIPKAKITASSFQPRFTTAEQKSVLPLVMTSLQNTFASYPDLLDKQQAEIYRQQLQALADDPTYVVDFVKNYCIIARR